MRGNNERRDRAQRDREQGDKEQGYTWQSLDDELALWSQAGRNATFWWRDDDACSSTPELERLLQISEKFAVPISLAVIPAKMENSLCKRLFDNDRIAVLQHGYRHRNHAPFGEKKSEYGEHRLIDEMSRELEQGKAMLQCGFGEQFRAVLVPPWNRYSVHLLPRLVNCGYLGMSAMWARIDSRLFNQSIWQLKDPLSDPTRLLQVNTHIDPIAWRHDRGFIGENEALEQLVCHLQFRREFPQLGDEPTGLLSHHVDQPESVWEFCLRFASTITDHDSCRWLSASDIWRHESAQ